LFAWKRYSFSVICSISKNVFDKEEKNIILIVAVKQLKQNGISAGRKAGRRMHGLPY
jgi:hypothetical protein